MSANCYIGQLLNEVCHKEDYDKRKDLHKLIDLSDYNLKLLSYRVIGFDKNADNVICDFHYCKFIKYYPVSYNYCSNPYRSHTKRITLNLITIKLELSEDWQKKFGSILIPGQKVCANCHNKIKNELSVITKPLMYCCDPFEKHRNPVNADLQTVDPLMCANFTNAYKINLNSDSKICNSCYSLIKSICSNYEMQADSNNTNVAPLESPPLSSNNTSSQSQISEYKSESQEINTLNSMLLSLQISPLQTMKTTNQNNNDKSREALNVLQSVIDKITIPISRVFDTQLPDLTNIEQTIKNSGFFEDFLNRLQMKYNQEKNKNERIRLLSLLPEGFPYSAALKYFDCSRYLFKEAQKLRDREGILAIRTRKHFVFVPQEVKDSIIAHYYNDLNSRCCSGVKEKIKKKIPGDKSVVLQKRILLYDLRELYNKWLEQNEFDVKPSFSLFASLRPKECVLAGGPGTHTVCVCPIHQNLKLKLHSFKQGLQYKAVIECGVCSIGNRNCMLHACEKCPGISAIRGFLESIDHKKNDITYNNWTNITSNSGKEESIGLTRTSLVSVTESYSTFLNKLVNDIWNVTEHHFVNEQQKLYLEYCKEHLDFDTCIILMDFAENYAFICQDSTQGFYFNNSQATLHPMVVYYKVENEDDLKVLSFCVISDSLKHTASSVHTFLEGVLNVVKQEGPWIKNIIYFTDGAPTQYKNKNHFINQCYHEMDFGLKVKSCNYFATSHGKSPCDGIGAVAKRTARKASLQRPYTDQILTPLQMYDYLKDNVTGVRFLYIDEKSIEARIRKLTKRFSLAKTIPQTRKHHFFQPIDKLTMRVKIFSFDTDEENVKIA